MAAPADTLGAGWADSEDEEEEAPLFSGRPARPRAAAAPRGRSDVGGAGRGGACGRLLTARVPLWLGLLTCGFLAAAAYVAGRPATLGGGGRSPEAAPLDRKAEIPPTAGHSLGASAPTHAPALAAPSTDLTPEPTAAPSTILTPKPTAAPAIVLTPQPTAAPTPSPVQKPAPREELRPATSASAPAISLLCFAWSPLSRHDVALYAEAKHNMARCDQYRVYTDTAHNDTISDGHIVRVEVPEQAVPRDGQGWLYHRNMVGMMPSLAHMLAAGEWSSFDWALNVELDHFVHADRVRFHIGHILDLLRAGGEQEQKDAGGPLMLMMGNAFAFNKAALAQLSRQWDKLGKVATELPAKGCPLFMKGALEYPEYCSQDVVFPHMVHVMQPGLPAYGASGCGQAEQTNGMGKRLPLACWDASNDFWNPWPTGSEDMQQLAIRVLAAVQHMRTPAEINGYLQTVLADNRLPDFCRERVAVQIKTNHFFTARKVPIIHHISFASVHRLARELLEP